MTDNEKLKSADIRAPEPSAAAGREAEAASVPDAGSIEGTDSSESSASALEKQEAASMPDAGSSRSSGSFASDEESPEGAAESAKGGREKESEKKKTKKTARKRKAGGRSSKKRGKGEGRRPELKELEGELQRERYKIRYRRALRSTVFTLVTVAALAILIATLWMPVLQIYGASMTPTLTDGDIVLSRKVRNLKQGDIVAFYYNNRILVKRYIANSGDWVDIDEEGNVYVNGEKLDEPYIYEKSLGETNIELPFQVPENRIFVLGDHRSVSIDSRSTSVGCVADDQIVGALVFCVWPFSNFGFIK